MRKPVTLTIDLCEACPMLGADELCRSAPWDPGKPSWGPTCRHPHAADRLAEAIDEDEPPPDWCPLRLTSNACEPHASQA